MPRITISPLAEEAIARHHNEYIRDETTKVLSDGQVSIMIDIQTVSALYAEAFPGESLSDTILRLAAHTEGRIQ